MWSYPQICRRYFNLLCRGYKGRIKNVTDREVRIELEAQARTVTVRRDQIPPEDGGAPMPRPAPFLSSGGATPAHAGMRTPAYPTATPKHWVISAYPEYLHPPAPAT